MANIYLLVEMVWKILAEEVYFEIVFINFFLDSAEIFS